MLATAIAAKVPLETLDLGDHEAAIWAKAIRDGTVPASFFFYEPYEDPVLPAVVFVLARVMAAKGDPEPALDAMFARVHPSRTLALARAEAARWRGDAAAAKTWETRAAGLEKLLVDDHAAVLAGLAGLW